MNPIHIGTPDVQISYIARRIQIVTKLYLKQNNKRKLDKNKITRTYSVSLIAILKSIFDQFVTE